MSRKLVAATIVWIVGTVAWFMGMMESGEWATFSYAILGIYGVTNVGEHATNAYKAKNSSPVGL